jgi:hypothetical protein
MTAIPVSVKVAGCSFRSASVAKIVNEVDSGNPVTIKLQEDPENQYDPNAVKVIAVTMDGDEHHVGFIPREDAPKAKEAMQQKRVEKIVIEKCGAKNVDGKARTWMTLTIFVLPKNTA